MDQGKIINRIAITYNPPRFKFEYTKGTESRVKYHKNVSMHKYFKTPCVVTTSSAEKAQVIASIVEELIMRHPELHQVPEKSICLMIEKLFTSYAQNTRHELPPTEVDDQCQTVRVNMAIERGTLTLSPLKVSKEPLKVSKDLDLKLYRDSFSSTKAPRRTLQADPTEENMSDMSDEDQSGHETSVPEQIQTAAPEPVSSTERARLESYGDPNRVSEEELAAAKEDMNHVFEQVQVLPGNVGYEYDKRIDFEPDEESSWD